MNDKLDRTVLCQKLGHHLCVHSCQFKVCQMCSFRATDFRNSFVWEDFKFDLSWTITLFTSPVNMFIQKFCHQHQSSYLPGGPRIRARNWKLLQESCSEIDALHAYINFWRRKMKNIDGDDAEMRRIDEKQTATGRKWTALDWHLARNFRPGESSFPTSFVQVFA